MSAFSSLFGNASVDENVNNLLKSSAGPVGRQDLKARTVIEIPQAEKPQEASASESAESAESASEEEAEEVQQPKQKKRKQVDEHESLEAEYYSKLLKEEEKENKDKKSKQVEEEKPVESGAESDSDESEAEETKPSEEDTKMTKTSKAKTVDLKEDELNKAERTVFVGNVSSSVITSKTTYKSFKKLFSSLGKVQSIRFRSIAFEEAVPRKVAFVKKALHNTRDSVNAYVVYKEKEPSKSAASKLNATVFDHHHLRVDHVAHPAPKDNKRTIFVGNLDFEEAEENLWRYFNAKVDDDVESVRVVRDAKTNLGKGFALIQFKDSLSVNKALFLHDKPMINEGDDKKKKPRKLRISRAKANAKPSILSPNHVDNVRKAVKPKTTMSDEQKTKLGRARSLLGRSDRSTAGKLIVEGQRASKGQRILGIKGLKTAKGKVKKPRITDRSSRFKKDKAAFNSAGNTNTVANGAGKRT